MTYSQYFTEVQRTRQFSDRQAPPRMAVMHHGATTSADQIVGMMVNETRQVSAHGVVKDGRRIGVVEDEKRAWSLSDAWWDSVSHVIECANQSTDGWTISEESHKSMGLLVADWSLRFGWWPHRSGEAKTWTVIGHREVYTIHNGSYPSACPGGMDLNKVVWYAQYFRNLWATSTPSTPTEEEELMGAAETIIAEVKSAIRREGRGRIVFDAGPNGTLPFNSKSVSRAAIVRPGRVKALSADPEVRVAKIDQWLKHAVGTMLVANTEVPQPMTTTEFHEYIDWCTDVDDEAAPFGRFVKNTFDVQSGPTRMVRVLPDSGLTYEFAYGSRQQAWQHGEPVELTKGGKPFTPVTKGGVKGAQFADKSFVALTATEVDRANAQRPDGQDWKTV